MEMRWVFILTLASMLWIQTDAQDRDEADVAIALHVAKFVKIKDIKKELHPFLTELISAADVDSGAVRFSLIVFGSDAKVQFTLDKHNKEKKLVKALKRLKPKLIRTGMADTAKMFDTLSSSVYVEASGDRPQVPNVLILMTDQKSAGNAQKIQESANELKAAGTKIFTIGLKRADRGELTGVASDPAEDNSYFAANYADLRTDELKNKLGSSFRVFQTLKTVPITTQPPPTTTTKQPETTPVQTTTTREPTTTVTVVPTPFVPPLSGSEEADIVIALHLSPTTTEFQFMQAINFLRTLVSGVDVETGRVKIGLMIYNADSEVIFHINQYTSMADIETVINSLSPDKRSFRVDASSAIGLSRQMLSMYFDRREDVPAALIFITDAPSTENADLLEMERDRAQQDGINIYSIGVGLRDKSELEMLATAPENVMTVSRVQELDFNTINELQRKIFAFRTRALVQTTTIAPPGPVRTVRMPTEEPPIRITLPSGPVGQLWHEDMLISDERNRYRSARNQTCGVVEFDLVILLDSSTSVTERNFKKMLNATKRFIADRDIDIDNGLVRVAMAIYSNTAEPQFYLNTYQRKRQILKAIDKIKFTYGRTNITGALKLMRTVMFTKEKGDRPEVPNVAIIVSDGVSTIQTEDTIPEANLARLHGIRIFGIGVGLANTSELEGIAGEKENTYSIDNFDELELKMDDLYLSICPVTESPTQPQLTCEDAAETDIVFVVDSSTSVGSANFETMLNAVKSFVNDIDIDSGKIQIGLLTYNTGTQIQFHLNHYRSKADVLRAIDRVEYRIGSTNTADAIKIARTRMFSERHGARENANHVMIVITDGISNMNYDRVQPESELSRSEGIVTLAVGVNVERTKELDIIAGTPENRLVIERFDQLQEKLKTLFTSICDGNFSSRKYTLNGIVISHIYNRKKYKSIRKKLFFY